MQNGIPVGLRSSPSFGLSRSGQLTAIIQSLFWDGSQGWWYDDNDTATLFQDSAGTTPVTAVEQFVGLQLDKSRGLVLGPELVTTPSTSVSGAQSVNVGGTITAGKFYKISATVSNYSGVGDLGFSGANFFVLAGVTRLSGNGVMAGIVWASGTGAIIVFGRSTNAATFSNISVRELPGNHRYVLASGNRPIWSKRVNLYVGTTALTTQNVTTQATSYVLRFSGTGSITLSGTATGSFNAGVHTVTCTAGTLTSTVSGTVTDADLRPANQATGTMPLYQRVNTSSDYDTNGFPGYLRADGIDDFLQTNTINFTSTDKITLCAGLRKLSDAAMAILYELSADEAVNNGSFAAYAPLTISTRYAIRSRGTAAAASTQRASTTSSVYAAPVTNILSALHNISADSTELRLNGVSVATATGDQGTGNFGNYPAYFFHRNTSPATLRFNGYEYGNVAVGKLLTADQLTALETYMNGLTKAY